MHKKILVTILTGVLAVSMLACGGNDNPAPTNSPTTTSTPAPSIGPETVTPATTDMPAPTMAPEKDLTPTPMSTKAPKETLTPTPTVAAWEMNDTTLVVRENVGGDDWSREKYPWNEYSSVIENIVVEQGVTKIGAHAFDGLDALVNVSLPETLTEVGAYAFGWSDALTAIEFPESVDSIGERAFYKCKGLTSVMIHGDVINIGKEAFEGTDALELFRVTGTVVNIGEEALGSRTDGDRDNLTVEIAGGISGTIGENAFRNCTKLTAIKLCEGLTSIGTEAFYGCKSWGETSVVFPSTLTHVGYSIFEGCGITELTISSNITTEERLCTTLETIHFAEGVTEIPAYLFKGMKIVSIELPAGITKIGEKAFLDCTALKAVTLPEGLQEIGANAFKNCLALETVKLSSTVTCIGEYAFQNCYKLKEINLPEGLKTIGKYAFDKCRALTSVWIPGSVETVEEFAFYDCSSLAVAVIEEGVTVLKKSAFSGCKALVALSLPDSVTSIGEKAFAFCYALNNVTLPANLESLGTRAFQDCQMLSEMVIPEKIKRIYSYTFSGCHALIKLELPEGVENIEKNAIPKTTTIYGVAGSYAESFAAEQGLTFVAGTIAESNVPVEIPVVEVSGDSALFTEETVKAAVLPTVEKLRDDGLIAEDYVCLAMDEASITFDITPGNATNDMVLSVDADGVYTLAMDYDFWFMEGFGPLVNGMDPAPYNKEMLLNFLGLISEEPATLFGTIDLVYFSSYGLSGTGYLAVGDCYMMDGLDSVPGAWSFKIKK